MLSGLKSLRYYRLYLLILWSYMWRVSLPSSCSKSGMWLERWLVLALKSPCRVLRLLLLWGLLLPIWGLRLLSELRLRSPVYSISSRHCSQVPNELERTPEEVAVSGGIRVGTRLGR